MAHAQTPHWLREQICTYYAETTERSYFTWGGDTLAMHIGLSPAVRQSDFRATLLTTNAFLADKANVGPGTRVLDAGCGIGGSSLWLAQERGARVVGITIDPGQVALARRFADERGVEGVTFECMDFLSTSFAPGTFDVVWNLESFCHVIDPEQYLTHVRNLLAPGGRFVCLDFFRGDAGDPRHCEMMCDGWVLPNLQRPAAVAELLRALDFENVELEDITNQTVVSGLTLRVTAGSVLDGMRERAMSTPVLERHYEAAIAAGEGLESGSIVYAYVAGRRPLASPADAIASAAGH